MERINLDVTVAHVGPKEFFIVNEQDVQKRINQIATEKLNSLMIHQFRLGAGIGGCVVAGLYAALHFLSN